MEFHLFCCQNNVRHDLPASLEVGGTYPLHIKKVKQTIVGGGELQKGETLGLQGSGVVLYLEANSGCLKRILIHPSFLFGNTEHCKRLPIRLSMFRL